MVFGIKYNEEKNQLLRATRGIGFEEAIQAIRQGGLLADIVHPSYKRPKQRMYVVLINAYAFALPYVINRKKQEIFLKTLYPSRALTKKCLKEGK